ncbi:hypothetical protein JHK87_010631 [Glycine soja]|nr:hypothetical protein JHK87_010631 [Glycine soja]
MPWRKVDKIASTLGFQSTQNINNYLDFPLVASRVKKSRFSFIVDKVNVCLARAWCWCDAVSNIPQWLKLEVENLFLNDDIHDVVAWGHESNGVAVVKNPFFTFFVTIPRLHVWDLFQLDVHGNPPEDGVSIWIKKHATNISGSLFVATTWWVGKTRNKEVFRQTCIYSRSCPSQQNFIAPQYHSEGKAGFGGVVHDSNGAWVVGYLGSCEGNQVADYLAKDGGAQGDDPLVILDICPLSLKPELLADALGV